jgi:diketogulonate reductase-like aldo/keto reductase
VYVVSFHFLSPRPTPAMVCSRPTLVIRDELRDFCAVLMESTTAPKFQGENFHANAQIREEISKLAKKKGCSLSQIALAWVAAQGMLAIPGTTKQARLESNWRSRDVELDEEELKEMRTIIDAAKPLGDRYGEKNAKLVGH